MLKLDDVGLDLYLFKFLSYVPKTKHLHKSDTSFLNQKSLHTNELFRLIVSCFHLQLFRRTTLEIFQTRARDPSLEPFVASLDTAAALPFPKLF